jgi:hypothetical protein
MRQQSARLYAGGRGLRRVQMQYAEALETLLRKR